MSFVASSVALPDNLAEIQAEVAWVNEQTILLGGGWPRGMLFQPIPYASIYDCYPQLFRQAFPSVAEDQLRDLALATRLFATSVFLGDKLMDETDKPEARAAEGLSVFAFQHEAHRILHRLFPHESPFWGWLGAYLKEYSQASLMEQGLAGGYIPRASFTEEMAMTIARGKSAISKAVIAGLSALSGSDLWLDPLTASTDHYNVAVQMLDDLIDWRKDAEHGMLSWVIARATSAHPTSAQDDKAAHLEQLGREIHYGGHTLDILRIALESLSKANDLVADIDVPQWTECIHRLETHCNHLRCDIERIIARNQQRVATQPTFVLSPIQPGRLTKSHAAAAQRSLAFLIQQWKLGFGEARHLQEFPTTLGFSSSDITQYGDTFQRALITCTLADAQTCFETDLDDVIQFEARYLDSLRRHDAVGGWKYFPDLIELAPDADDLAQMMQVMARTGQRDNIATVCGSTLDTLFNDCRHDDGSFETWIIPAKRRTPEQELQAQWAQTAWGHGPDTDVMANMLYALHLADLPKYQRHVDKGIDVILRRQADDGSWRSTWYYGPYYGTYVCARLLGCVEPSNAVLQAMRNAQSFLMTTQTSSGGWGMANTEDPLSTALAVLSLRHLNRFDTAQALDSAQRGLDWLARTIHTDGSWDAVPFIRMNNVWSYSSRTTTTAFVLSAFAHWTTVSQIA